MLFGNPELYAQARAAKRGKRKLSYPLEELRKWVSERYAVNVLYVLYDRIESGPHQGRPRLDLVVDTVADYAALHQTDHFTLRPDVKEAVLDQFATSVAAAGLGNKYDTRDVHLICDDFSDEAIGKAATSFRERYKDRLLREFAPFQVWRIDGFSKETVVFYLTDKDLQVNQKEGVSDRIRQRCYELTKQYDEFGYLELGTFPITFDSRENLDKNYEGNLFYYFR